MAGADQCDCLFCAGCQLSHGPKLLCLFVSAERKDCIRNTQPARKVMVGSGWRGSGYNLLNEPGGLGLWVLFGLGGVVRRGGKGSW